MDLQWTVRIYWDMYHSIVTIPNWSSWGWQSFRHSPASAPVLWASTTVTSYLSFPTAFCATGSIVGWEYAPSLNYANIHPIQWSILFDFCNFWPFWITFPTEIIPTVKECTVGYSSLQCFWREQNKHQMLNLANRQQRSHNLFPRSTRPTTIDLTSNKI